MATSKIIENPYQTFFRWLISIAAFCIFASHVHADGSCPDSYFKKAAERFGINPNLIKAIALQESRCSQWARGQKGEIGIMQIWPPTARTFGWNLSKLKWDSKYNILCGSEYLRYIINTAKRRWGNQGIDAKIDYIIGAYNAGEDVIKTGWMPNITRSRYVPSVKRIYASLGDGAIERERVAININPWIEAYEYRSGGEVPTKGNLLSIIISVKNLGKGTAENTKLVFTLRKDAWGVPASAQPEKVRIHSGNYEWIVEAELGRLGGGQAASGKIVVVPKKSGLQSYKVRAVMTGSGRSISYPHESAPEFLDSFYYPAKSPNVMISGN